MENIVMTLGIFGIWRLVIVLHGKGKKSEQTETYLTPPPRIYPHAP